MWSWEPILFYQAFCIESQVFFHLLFDEANIYQTSDMRQTLFWVWILTVNRQSRVFSDTDEEEGKMDSVLLECDKCHGGGDTGRDVVSAEWFCF